MSELKLQQCRLDGRYDLLDCLGRGSYSEVYVARDVAAADGSPHVVVIKALNPFLQGAPDYDLERTLLENFRNEAVALDRVRHPNIINRLGHGTAIDLSGRTFHYLVLEYLPGGDLQAFCRNSPLPLERAIFYLRQVSAGLQHAHDRGVIHRDVKPQNLLLTADQQTVKIADFGVAKLEATNGTITRVGTDVYAAPEHHPLLHTGPLDPNAPAHRTPQLTPAADVYSLAKTTYMLLTGEPPRRFSQKPVTELPAPFASQPWGRFVASVLHRATQHNPADRQQSVREFWEELSDATMPRTRTLRQHEDDAAGVMPPPALDEEGGRRRVATPAPSPASFTPSTRPQNAVADSQRPRIVVPVAAERGPNVVEHHERPPEHARAPHPEVYEPRWVDEHAAPRPRLSDRARRWLIAVVLIAAFAGMLLATHRYVSRRRASEPPVISNQQAAPVGREFVTTTDVNLRGGPSRNSARVGMADRGAKVKVVNTNGGWYEVVVTERQRPKEDPASSDQGWLDSDYLKKP